MKTTKFVYLYVIQQYYIALGWEDVGAHDKADNDAYKNARQELKLYRENQPEYPARIIERREAR